VTIILAVGLVLLCAWGYDYELYHSWSIGVAAYS